MIKVFGPVLFFMVGLILTQHPPPSGDTHFLLTNNVTNLAIYGIMDSDDDQMPTGECGLCKALLAHIVKQVPANGSEPEAHLSSVIHDACEKIKVSSHKCTEFVKTFHAKVEPTKATGDM
ncbi:hypothetical protein AALO_G00057730 [Alosa alosa]|uniref:Saposin B-type domain-containing protein n=1 Tax=Alosa alosa TaxID=278164 RepID=A0AAV6HAX6_9TELE|nr:hypothetical protein AALO_G00057730 [Alosa alosa]